LKYLVTSGCSFTAYERCWPYRLVEQLGKINYTLINDAEGSSGNAMIHRRIIYQVGKLLAQGIDKDDILVGVMWSGANRHNIHDEKIERIGKDDVNPYYWPEEGGRGAWEIFCATNSSRKVMWYYQHVFSYYQSVLETYEYINHLQNYLQMKDVKYFMCPYMDGWDYEGFHDNDDPYIRMLVDSIDYSKWPTKQGQWEWVKENYANLKLANPKHPGPEQNNLWVEKVIIPWLKENNYV
tara:strand:+ start:471 stop:1184 length:714 start_codon:yes stop_codon:yes gene_type:complete